MPTTSFGKLKYNQVYKLKVMVNNSLTYVHHLSTFELSRLPTIVQLYTIHERSTIKLSTSYFEKQFSAARSPYVPSDVLFRYALYTP